MKHFLILLIATIMKTTLSAQTWVDRSLYPFESKFMELQAGKMHYLDQGQGDPILFVHGTPTWSFLYREFVNEFASTHRCLAIDHLGFGLSEKPKNISGKPEDHARNLREFIHRLDLQNLTLVVHDFGGPIGLGAALTEPERIKKVVLMNSWLWSTKENPDAQKIDKLIHGWLGRSLYLNFNFSPKVLLKQGFADKKNLSKKVHKQYIQPFPSKSSRIPLLRLAEALVGSSDWYQNQWGQLNKLADKEWLILWGMKDKFITPAYLEKWKSRLPQAKIKELDCGHFVQEEKPKEAMTEIRSFLR